MSILTADFSELINERKRIRESTEASRPTRENNRLKWRDIQDFKDDREIERLESNQIEIG